MEKIWIKNYPKSVPAEVDADNYRSVVDVFLKSCEKYSERPAFSNFGKDITFKELERLSGYFAAYLQKNLGLKKGDRIAIQMPNLLQYPIALFGALRAGLVVVNTNPLYTAREMEHQFKDSGAKALIVLKNFADKVEAVFDRCPDLEHVIVTEVGDLLGFPKRMLVNSVTKYVKKMVPKYHLEDEISFTRVLLQGAFLGLDSPKIDSEDLAFLQYTGGTTGVAKGAMLTHRNMVANMEQISCWMAPLLREIEEVVITPLPLYHIFSLTVNCMSFIKIGGRNVLITNPRDMKGFVKTLAKEPFTVLTGVNTLYNGLLNTPEFHDLDFSTLKTAVGGGMAVQKAVAEKWKEVTSVPLIEGFGLTETAPVLCCNPLDGNERIGTIGMPVSSTDVSIRDEEGNEVKPGESGEICARGPQVMKGYWQRPEETKKVFWGDEWFRTGDVAVMQDDGYFKIVDRMKDMILVSGFNVYPNEVEDVVAEHPGVLEVAAVGVPDEKSGEAVKIFVVPKNTTLTVPKLKDYCRENLTGYKCPKFIEFREELPKTNVGKILRRALREEGQAQA